MKLKDIKPSREFNKTYDQNYKALIAAVLGQAIQDYAFPQSFRFGGGNGRAEADEAEGNSKKLDEFFDGEWCELLCDAINFPRQILAHRDAIAEAGEKYKGGRKKRGRVKIGASGVVI